MKSNKMTVIIDKPLREVFEFTTQAPNTKYWLPGVIDEIIDSDSVGVGTKHTLTQKDGDSFSVVVTDFEENKHIEWVSEDGNTYCRYTYRVLDDDRVELEYHEWVEDGEFEDPLEQSTLEKLKQVIESK